MDFLRELLSMTATNQIKPGAKLVHDVLKSKKGGGHKSPKTDYDRSKAKKEISDAMKEGVESFEVQQLDEAKKRRKRRRQYRSSQNGIPLTMPRYFAVPYGWGGYWGGGWGGHGHDHHSDSGAGGDAGGGGDGGGGGGE